MLICLVVLVHPLAAPTRGASVESMPAIDWEDYESVSMIQLIAAPQDFEGRKVRVHGFVTMRFESLVLYLTRDDMEYGNRKNGLWLGLRREQKTKKIEGRFVLVFGVFTVKDKGHRGANSGTLDDIARIEEVPGRKSIAP